VILLSVVVLRRAVQSTEDALGVQLDSVLRTGEG
jgi:hypothetical protein